MARKIYIALVIAIMITLTQVRTTKAYTLEEKITKLNLVLRKYNSPMQGMEKVLIETAERYNLDWTLLAGISGTESSFAKRMPYKCNNPFGWGIYGKNKLCFDNLEEAIKTVGKGIGTRYNTSSLESIARTYNSVNTKHWIKLTKFFMNMIEQQTIPVSTLPITL